MTAVYKCNQYDGPWIEEVKKLTLPLRALRVPHRRAREATVGHARERRAGREEVRVRADEDLARRVSTSYLSRANARVRAN